MTAEIASVMVFSIATHLLAFGMGYLSKKIFG